MANRGEVPLTWVLECAACFGILLRQLQHAQQSATGHDTLPVGYIQPVEVVHSQRRGRPRKQPNIQVLRAAMAGGHNISVSKLDTSLEVHCNPSSQISCIRPNALWHMDGHHKLIRWGIVIHGIVDGYCHTWKSMGYLHVHGDRGGENKEVSVFMIYERPESGQLHVGNLFLQEIRADCTTFCEEWNSHPVSGEGHDQSPRMFLPLLGCTAPNQPAYFWGSSDNEEWEDVLDDNDMATEHSDLPSMIADDQAPEFAHDGAAVPLEVNPFPSPDWQAAFWQALQHVQEIGHIPSGYGMLEQEWGGMVILN
ncbi:hypothetical protein EDC04DRAFT_2616344 [Pisolithus marmoratus]|nr:hypothetical protein EDC04DRAFT_2616344 [Pisolithus marmoratus]